MKIVYQNSLGSSECARSMEGVIANNLMVLAQRGTLRRSLLGVGNRGSTYSLQHAVNINLYNVQCQAIRRKIIFQW
jgi:hypothetical protein